VKIVVTGAGGNLGRVVIPALREAGHDVREFDLGAGGDVRNADAVARAVEGVDAVVHAAALHGVHLDRWSPHDFWATNVTGTFNVYAAAPPRVVLCSTMGVYGHPTEEPATIDEDAPVSPRDVYGLSKALCEEIARFHARSGETKTVALRLGMFVPETFERYGFRLLFGGVDDRDVAQAVLLALDHEPAGGFDVFDVMAATPLAPEDAQELANDPLPVLERHWPGVGEVVARRRVDVGEVVWGATLWPVEKARRVLGYEPRYGFGEFLAALDAGDESHYPFAGLPQWGV
jgi:nucleoside-diphosphate-sugar epimerase